MAQLFHRSTNTVARVSIFGGLFLLAGAVWVFATLQRSSWNTRQEVTVQQPVPFSHKHHVAGLGLDCRYCHTSVEKSASAGIPPTATCMNCHRLIWNDSPMLEPVRRSFETGQPLTWTRVHDLPAFVYFDHSIHVAKGIGCETCHGRVDQMPLMNQRSSLQMEWCVDCHKDPARNVRPKDAVFTMGWKPPADVDEKSYRTALAREYRVTSKLSCSVCHR